MGAMPAHWVFVKLLDVALMLEALFLLLGTT